MSDLLIRWHRWASPPVRVPDTLMQDFDRLLDGMPADLRLALIFQARNLAGGLQVWSTPRPQGDIGQARACLMRLLEMHETRWFGPMEIKVNARGNRIGESNPKAALSDSEVELLLEMRAERYTYKWLAEKFEVHWTTVRSICRGRTRGQAAFRTKKVER